MSLDRNFPAGTRHQNNVVWTSFLTLWRRNNVVVTSCGGWVPTLLGLIKAKIIFVEPIIMKKSSRLPESFIGLMCRVWFLSYVIYIAYKIYYSGCVEKPQREKSLNTVLYFTVLGQIISIYRHTKTVYGNIQDRIQAFFMQWSHKNKCYLTLFSLGFLGLLSSGGIFSFPLPNFCSSNATFFKFCRKVVLVKKIPKKIFWHDDVIILDDVSIFLLLHFVTCVSLFTQ